MSCQLLQSGMSFGERMWKRPGVVVLYVICRSLEQQERWASSYFAVGWLCATRVIVCFVGGCGGEGRGGKNGMWHTNHEWWCNLVGHSGFSFTAFQGLPYYNNHYLSNRLLYAGLEKGTSTCVMSRYTKNLGSCLTFPSLIYSCIQERRIRPQKSTNIVSTQSKDQKASWKGIQIQQYKKAKERKKKRY